MVAAKAGNYTPAVDEIDSWVAQIACFYSVYVQHYYLILPHRHQGVVVSQTTNLVEPYWLSLVEIHSSTLYVHIIL